MLVCVCVCLLFFDIANLWNICQTGTQDEILVEASPKLKKNTNTKDKLSYSLWIYVFAGDKCVLYSIVVIIAQIGRLFSCTVLLY